MIKFDETRGVWVREEVDGTYILSDSELKGAVKMSDKLAMVKTVRENMTAFIESARALRVNLEDLALLDMLPTETNAIVDADIPSEGITAAQFYAGVQAFAALNPTPTGEQSKALARMAVRK
jgi:hypothetical protein